VKAVKKLVSDHKTSIIFYNFDYELEILRKVCKELKVPVGEWNGHKHQDIPKGERWAYLVQYTAGCEGWNCIKTNVVIFYSQNYSYRTLVQASGRIDRRNTPFSDLYYYSLKSRSPIDIAIARAVNKKSKFNEGKFVKW
jgi:superfamily II DNA or RNA helicase